MFISYKYKEYLGKKDGKPTWRYELTDSEFGTVSAEMIGNWVGKIGTAVIQEYRKRNLNVAANLVMAFIWYNKQHPWHSIHGVIDYNKRYNQLFQPYEKDLQKYLLLL
jgi:hypothetical protein